MMPTRAWKAKHRNIDMESLSKIGDLQMTLVKDGAEKDSSW